MIKIDIIKEIQEVVKLLDKLETFENQISEKNQYYDYKISDLYHKLECMKLNSKNCYRFCKELKSVLLERRNYKSNVLLFSKYRMNINKLIANKDNRQLMLSEIHKREKNINLPYKNRVYTEEELNEIIGS